MSVIAKIVLDTVETELIKLFDSLTFKRRNLHLLVLFLFFLVRTLYTPGAVDTQQIGLEN